MVDPRTPHVTGSPSRPSDARGALLAVVVTAVPMVALAWARYRLQLPSGDEPHYLVISEALAKHGSLDVQQVYDHRDYWSFFPQPLEPHVAPGPNGQQLPLHSIGGPVLWLLPYVLWGRAGVIAFMTVVSLLIVANVFWLLRQLAVERSVAVCVAIAFGLGTPILTYSAMSFVEPLGALGCLYALRVALRREPSCRDLLVVSTVLGVLPWVHSRFLLFPPVFLAVLVVRLLRARGTGWRRRLVCAVGPAAVLFAGLEVFDRVVWGTWNLAPNQVNAGAVPFRADPLPGLLGTVLDQEAGVAPNFPIFLFVLPGLLFAATRRYRTMNVLVLATVVPYTVVVSSFLAWDGAWSPPARFAAVVLPMLAGYVGIALQRTCDVFTGTVAAALTAAATALTALAVGTASGGFSARLGRSPTLGAVEATTHLPITRYVPSSALDGQQLLFLTWALGVIGFAWLIWLRRARDLLPTT
ncbi:hypothetical protein ACQEVB_24775 [Pseudonocardia sp. CA-107938]|uniref:hypothetical protein n=1 Tax=Pseudonocardia sp. CA-107938 TaxID=3240021 RepID=UPI003D910F23